MEGQTFAVYRSIIDEVLDKVRADFQAEGVDERVIQELQMVCLSEMLDFYLWSLDLQSMAWT
jgi:hypothetical protein